MFWKGVSLALENHLEPISEPLNTNRSRSNRGEGSLDLLRQVFERHSLFTQ